MDISTITSTALGGISSTSTASPAAKASSTGGFDSVLSSALDLLKETNDLAANAEAEEIKFALGQTDNTHDLSVAMQKAAVSLQYTVSVKNALLDAYKEIMNIQI